MHAMKILVTGAGGFVGGAVVRRAQHQGHHAIALVRPGGSSPRLAGAIADRVLKADLRDADAMSALLAVVRPDVVVHSAWSGVSGAARFDRAQFDDNVAASCGLVDAAAAAGVRKFVGIGSQGEYGPLEGEVSEESLPAPTSLYGASKLAVMHLARQLCAQHGMGFA